MIELLAALPGVAAISIGTARWRAWRYPARGWRRTPPGARFALFAAAALAIGACHSIERGAFAHAPVPTSILPFTEPLKYTVGPNAGSALPTQNGLLASYFAGAQYERLDHQQIDPNVNFIWDATGNPVITAPDGIDTNEGDPFLPDTWGIWSVVWEGYLDVPAADTYGLRIHVNNGGWLELKDPTGALFTVINCSGGTSFEGDCDANAPLTKGRSYLRFSYFNNAPSSANAILSWQPPGAADFSVIPTESLFTQAAATNTPPTVRLGDLAPIFSGDVLESLSFFVDPDSGQTWSATVDYGDSSGPSVLPLDGSRFTLSHRYAHAGTFAITVVVTDSAGAIGTGTVRILVRKIPLIFVPGIFGSELEATSSGFSDPIPDGHGGNNRILYPGIFPCGNPVWLNACQAALGGEEDYFDLLKFDPATGAPYVSAITPNEHLVTLPTTPYATTERFFAQQGYVQGSDFFIFNYDWRYPAETSARVLDARVAQVLRSSGAPRVDIVAHSLGGLVVRSFLVAGTQRANAARVVILGAPELGTPLFGYALLGGTCLPPLSDALGCLISADEVADVSRAIPSAVEIAPSAEYYRVFPNFIGVDHPSAYVDARLSVPGQPPVDGSQQALISREIEAGVTASYIPTSAAFHADDRSWLNAVPSTTRVYLVAGTGKPTVGQVIERWARVTVPLRDVNGLIIGQIVKLTSRVEARFVDGDTRVVTQSASLNESTTPPANVTVVYVNTVHEFLTDENVLPVTMTLLQGEDAVSRYPGFAANRGAQPSGVIISGHSPIELIASDATGRRVGSADGRRGFSELPNARYDRLADAKFLTLLTPQAVTMTLYGTADGDGLVRVRRMQDGAIVSQSVFTHVPTRPGSIATFPVDAAGIAGTMQVDLDGDGRIDVVLTPTALTAAAADDLTPPTISITSPDARTVVGSVPVSWVATDALSGVASSSATLDGDLQTGYISGASVPVGPGPHSIDVFAEDRAGNSTITSRSFNADDFTWDEPLNPTGVFVSNAGRTIPVKFSVTTPGGAFVSDTSVTVVLVDRTGRAVVGPLLASTDPSSGVAIGAEYHADVSTKGLPPGTYWIRISFNSSTLVGAFSHEVSLR